MIEIGRTCVKLTGREAGKKCIIVDIVDHNFVIIDGNVKRRKCNIDHIELLPETFEIKKNASTDEIKKIFKEKGLLEEKKLGIAKKRPRKAGERPKRIRPRRKTAPAEKGKTKKAKKQSDDEMVEAALAKV